MMKPTDRRSFLKQMSAAAGAALVAQPLRATAATKPEAERLHLSCNQYTWFTYYRREEKDFFADLDAGLAKVKASGMDGYEPALTSPDQVDTLAPLLEKHSLEMRSVYVNSKLHERDEADKSIDEVMAIAERVKPLGTRIIVTNPNPIRWGGPENKDDTQLATQAEALGRLGAALRRMDLTLSYHTHDPEFRAGAREFHHMMLATNPEHMSFCMDVHWVYRGAGNSNLAVFDVLKLYGHRITELHIRQSTNHRWSETFGPGDIDYPAFVEALIALDLRPHLVIEQATEEGTPHTLSALEAHRQSHAYASELFAPLAG